MINESIIVIPSTNKLGLSLAYHNKNLFNTRFLKPSELALDILNRKAIAFNSKLISRKEELLYYKKIVDTNKYFNTNKLSDIKNINNAINTIRNLVCENEIDCLKDTLAKGIFSNKNNALFNIYKEYINVLNDNNLIDSIGLIRYAIDNIDDIDLDITIIKEYPLQPLEIALLNKLTSNIKTISIFDLYGVKEEGIKVDSYKNCYGSSNEVASILDDIFTNSKMDECLIACGDYSSYSQIIFDYACKYDIDVTFNEGLAIVNSYPGKLLKQYNSWSSEGQFGWLPFNKLIYSPFFDLNKLLSLINVDSKCVNELFEIVSKLRLTNDLNINLDRIKDYKEALSKINIIENNKLSNYLPAIEIIANELSLPLEQFIDKYSIIRNNNAFLQDFDISAKKTIINEILSIKNIGIEINDDAIDTILAKTTLRKSNTPGHICVCSIDSGLSCLRKELYVCGLSSTIYPGMPRENPLLLDSDLNDFNNNELTSNGRIKHKHDALFSLLKLATSLDNKIHLSYPGLNISELKNNNASSLLFEIYKQEHKDNKSLNDFKNEILNVSYFEPNLSKTKQIGQAYNRADEILYNALDSNNNDVTCLKLNRYSPSALNTFFNCKKQFFYQYLIGIKTPDDYNPYEVISATNQGSLVHSLMEYLSNHKMSKQEFIKLGEEVFNEYMKICVPLVREKIDFVRQEFVEMLENGWQMDEDNKRTVFFAEEDKEVKHSKSGIIIHGFPDRVETLDNGKAVIVDFKTERDKNAHIKDDIDSCLQVLIYAYIIENALNKEVDHCEYRMLRYENGIVTCKYDQQMKELLDEKLIEFKNTIDSGDFSIEPMDTEQEKEKCKYCAFGTICGKVVIDDEK